MKDDFNVEHFVVECRRKVPLEMLRSDLQVYLKILQSAMIELINKDYADFVNLSTNLIGMDKAINNLLNPLNHLKHEILNVRNAMVEASMAVDEKMKQQIRIRDKKECLRTLMGIIQSLEKMEKLLGIQPSDSTQTNHFRELNGQLIERVATEFNKLQFYVGKCRGMPLVEEIKPRIANITMMLQFSLEGSFKEGLNSGNSEILRDCLRTYATIDKMRDAETLFRTFVVKGYMEEIVNEQYLRSHSQGLEGLYNAILDFFPRHCAKLCELTTTGFAQGSKDIISGYDFVVNSVWPEVVGNLEARMNSIFAPGNPNIFHEKYTISINFVENFERQCGSQASVKRLRTHPSYNTFMSKWSLPVYFQIRFQEIAGSLENALLSPFALSTDKTLFHLQCSAVLWDCLHRCWSKSIYLVPLCHRFWKLTLQLLSRYAVWTAEVHEELANRPLPQRDSSANLQQLVKTANGDSNQPTTAPSVMSTNPSGSSAITISNIVLLVSDAQKVTTEIPDFFDSIMAPLMKEIGNENLSLLKDGLKDAEESILLHMSHFETYLTTEITAQCVTHLKSVNDIPRLYRRTNREVPSKPSLYATSLVRPLVEFLTEYKGAISEVNRKQWAIAVLKSLGEQFLSATTDVLTAVKKMEESLKRLKAGRGTSVAGGMQGMSDDDKIRQQLYLDVKEFGHQMTSLRVSETEVEVYRQLHELVRSAIATTGAG